MVKFEFLLVLYTERFTVSFRLSIWQIAIYSTIGSVTGYNVTGHEHNMMSWQSTIQYFPIMEVPYGMVFKVAAAASFLITALGLIISSVCCC